MAELGFLVIVATVAAATIAIATSTHADMGPDVAAGQLRSRSKHKTWNDDARYQVDP